MNLKRLRVLEIKKVYLDGLAEWVEVPVFNQDELIQLVNAVDWEGLDMRQYKKILTEHWPGLAPSVKAKIKNPTARNELYEVLINENWGLAPSVLAPDSYSQVEKRNIELWFSSNKTRGRKPDVLS